jgi:dihydrofolate synthase / folylpolyglutamate synthase
MNYQQTVEYLFSRLPLFSRIGDKAIKKDLTNTIKLCEHLGNPHTRFRSVHIGGTNGKGSVSHMLAAILQTAGYKTGLYTSPHLKDFRERIKVNGQMINEEYVVQFTDRIKHLIEEIEPSFFEITVAMAFDYFAMEKIDIAVVEVGLGGRLDSTNIITPDLSVITNIGWDHMNILGDSLPEIAAEKAGIIKEDIPVVIGESSSETAAVFKEKSSSVGAPIMFADELRFPADWHLNHSFLEVAIAESPQSEERKTYQLDLTGYYQIKNLVTVLEAVEQLCNKGWHIKDEHVVGGLRHVKKLTALHGRWEIVQRNPTVVLDVAHNEDGMKQLVAQLELTDHKALHIVIGMVKDKEVDKVLQFLPKHANYYFTKAQIPRALNEKKLSEMAQAYGLSGNHYPAVQQAIDAAIHIASKEDLVLVCGSVFVVGETNLFAV